LGVNKWLLNPECCIFYFRTSWR